MLSDIFSGTVQVSGVRLGGLLGLSRRFLILTSVKSLSSLLTLICRCRFLSGSVFFSLLALAR